MDINASLVFVFFNGYSKEVRSPKNEWYTGEVVNPPNAPAHKPTFDEMLIHYLVHGGDTGYRVRFELAHPGYRSLIASASKN